MIYGDRMLKDLVMRGDIRNTYDGAINPASINLRLGGNFKVIVNEQQCIELGGEVEYADVPESFSDRVVIAPGGFMLATTREWINVPIGAAAFVQGRSSIGRAGLSIQNAGFVDPAFSGHLTLELKNDGPLPIVLCPDYPIAQLIYMEAKDVLTPYNGKYKDQVEATGSKMYLDELTPENQKEINAE